MQTRPVRLAFYVWHEASRQFRLVDEASVKCPDCGARDSDMNLILVDRLRGEWMLECACGEQFNTHND